MADKKAEPVAAFPRTYGSGGHDGMTLRDYFAAKALIGLLPGYDFEAREASADQFRTGMDDRMTDLDQSYAEGMANEAYIIADAMLARRSRQ